MTEPRQATVELEARYGRHAAEVLERLRRAKAQHGRIEPADIERIAAELGIPRAHVNGAASFYADLSATPVAERHVRVCAGTACFAATGGSHVADIERVLPAGTSVQPVYCLGYCYGGPAALDGETPRSGADLVEQLLGEPADAAPLPFAAAVDDPVVLCRLTGSGPPAWQTYQDARARGGEHVQREVLASRLRGRGGAGFPAARKWAFAAAAPSDGPRYVVCNGDEGDPGSYADRLLMEQDPDGVLEGMALAALASGATRGVAYVRSEYPAARDALRRAAEEARAAGHLGAHFDVEVFEGAGSYVAGEETSLLHSIEGLRGAAAARPPYPPGRGGLLGRPTVVNNVETLAAVPWIVAHGGAAYAARGTEASTGTKLACLNERFERPGVYEVELGTSLHAICDELGGGIRDRRPLRSLQIGGPLGGFLGPGQLDTTFDFESVRAAGAELGHGGIVAFDDTVSGRALLLHVWQFVADESCGTCFPCRVGSRRGLEIARRIAHGEASAQDFRNLDAIVTTMGSASLCGFGLGVPLPVRALLRIYAEELAP
jgi:NADH:ubiquinone oxidoreductase subunit F (NADH-binding)/NADH:ubiquinone oxidoreductase subunit E